MKAEYTAHTSTVYVMRLYDVEGLGLHVLAPKFRKQKVIVLATDKTKRTTTVNTKPLLIPTAIGYAIMLIKTGIPNKTTPPMWQFCCIFSFLWE